MRPLRALALFAVFAAMGAGAFFSVRLLMDEFFAEAQDSDAVITPRRMSSIGNGRSRGLLGTSWEYSSVRQTLRRHLGT